MFEWMEQHHGLRREFERKLVRSLSGSRFQNALCYVSSHRSLDDWPRLSAAIELRLHGMPGTLYRRDFGKTVPSRLSQEGEAHVASQEHILHEFTRSRAPCRTSAERKKAVRASEVVRQGLVAILKSFLESRDESLDTAAIEKSLAALERKDGGETAIADALRPLYVKEAGKLTGESVKEVAEALYGHLKPYLKKGKRRRGSTQPNRKKGLKGTKTKTMARQLNAFVDYIARKRLKSGGIRSEYEEAHKFWNDNRCAKAAKAEGGRKGYKDYRVLTNAYRNLATAKPPMRPLG